MKKVFVLLVLCATFACDSDENKSGRFFIKGNEALNKGEYNEAVRLYSEAIAINDKYVEAYNNRGVAYYRDRKYIEAINDYTTILLQVDPEFSDAKRNRVNAYLDAKRYEKALEDLDDLEGLFPDSAYVDFNRGLVYHEMKDFIRSIEAFNAALIKDEGNPEILINAANGYFMLKDFDKAEGLLNQAEMIDASEPNIYNTQALIETSKENYDVALDLVEEALKLDATNPYFLNNRGFIYLMQGDIVKAGPDIRRAIIGASDNGWGYRNRGILLYMQENHEGAIRNFERAEKLEGKIPLMLDYWVASLKALGRTEEACEKVQGSPDEIKPKTKAGLSCG
ncbi:tetratricopeptide repeat protein [Roseivirga sp. E12]|uniref:tetratricopeptide repeat protein n=1 Tax=Roseivirga sp. E12 TaxID=2819237 RepID=UPI001ABC67A6|nr:tetratricopeptide repeat protein [Roseivirga sp. E12]